VIPSINIREIIKRLKRAYPKTRATLRNNNPYRILVSTILSAQCTDKVSEKITALLFKKYHNIKNLAKTRQPVLEREIYSSGFYHNKAKNIIAGAKKIIKEYGSKVPQAIGELLSIPGVGRKTANIVLSAGFGKAEGIAVDTHVARISKRVGLSREKDPNKIEQDLLKIVPKNDWLDFNYIMVSHGRKICRSRNPLCLQCVINNFCQYYRHNI
jgi:endonuclease-3